MDGASADSERLMASAVDGSDDSTVVARPRTPCRQHNSGRVWVVLVYALMAAMGGVIGGYSHGFPSPTLLDLQEAYDSGERETAFSSSTAYAGLFGVSEFVPLRTADKPLPLNIFFYVHVPNLRDTVVLLRFQW